MADINQVVSLGIGSPAGIPEFLTFGLQIAEVVVVVGELQGVVEMSAALNGTTIAFAALGGDVELTPLINGNVTMHGS